MAVYMIINGPMQTTAAQAPVTTGTAIKTLLQVKPGTGVTLTIVEWGISFDGSVAATPIKCELIETDVAATVTASVAADVTRFDPNAQDPTTSALVVGTAATGYTSTAEGTITSVRDFDVQFIAPTNQYFKQFPLGFQPQIQVSKFARIRVTAGAAVNAYAYMVVSV